MGGTAWSVWPIMAMASPKGECSSVASFAKDIVNMKPFANCEKPEAYESSEQEICF